MAEKKRSTLLDDLEKPRPDYIGGPCKLKVIKDAMDDEESAGIDRAVERVRMDTGQGRSKSYSASWLTRMLRKNGYNISVSTVQRHVNKECPCERTAE